MTLNYEIRQLKEIGVWGESTGFEICGIAHDGEMALKMLRSEHYDLVVSEISIPLLDGLGLLKTIKKEGLHTLFVALNNESDFQYVRECIIYGAFDYLQKIPQKKDLVSMLDRAREELILEDNKNRNNNDHLESYLMDITSIENAIVEHRESAYHTFKMLAEVIMQQNKKYSVEGDIVLRHVFMRIIDDIFERLNWLHLYVNKDEYYKLDSYYVSEGPDVMDSYWEKLKKLSDFIHLFLVPTSDKNVAEVIDYALNNPEENIRLKAITEKLYMNYSYLSNLFSKQMGFKYTTYSVGVKMRRAAFLLKNSDDLISNIALNLGYKDYPHFIILFREMYGMNPKEYRDKDKSDYMYDYAQI